MSYTRPAGRCLFAVLLSLLVAACDSGDDDGAAVAPAADVGETQPRTPADAGPEPPAAREVAAESLPYGEVDEQLVYGSFVYPVDMVEPLPAVIMIHSWYGLDDHVRDAARRLAGQGYIVLAVDLFGGETATTTNAARGLMQDVTENRELANDNIRQAWQFVSATAGAPRIAVLGWSMGGDLAVETAMQLPDGIDAVVNFYGQVPTGPEELAPITAPILGLFAGQDRGVTPEVVSGFEATLEQLGKTYEIHTYPGARHAFAHPSAAGYDPGVARDAWQRVLRFLTTHLAQPG